jgi:hypothetical protein
MKCLSRGESVALSPFDLAGYFVDDSNEPIAARSRSKKLHGNKDIDASGDEVEIPIRVSAGLPLSAEARAYLSAPRGQKATHKEAVNNNLSPCSDYEIDCGIAAALLAGKDSCREPC